MYKCINNTVIKNMELICGHRSPYRLLVTVTRTYPTAIPKTGKNTVQDVVKINPWEKNKINDLTTKPLPVEVTKF